MGWGAQKRALSPEGVPMKRFPERSAAACCRPQSKGWLDHLCLRALSCLSADLPPAAPAAIRGLHAAWQAGNTCCSPSRTLYSSSDSLQGRTVQLSQLMHQLKPNHALERELVGEVQMMCCEPLLAPATFSWKCRPCASPCYMLSQVALSPVTL